MTIIKCIYWAGTLAETTSILAAHAGIKRSLEYIGKLPLVLLRHATSATDTVTPPPVFIAGSLLSIAGGLIRFACYRAIGHFFSFRPGTYYPGHALITFGPYGVVWHPGYTGLLMYTLGTLTVHLSPGSWLRRSGMLGNVWMKGAVCAWGLGVGVVTVSVVWQRVEEDRMMRERFRALWEAWAREVRYRLVPGVYK